VKRPPSASAGLYLCRVSTSEDLSTSEDFSLLEPYGWGVDGLAWEGDEDELPADLEDPSWLPEDPRE
jgi:hypothetical protein